MAIFDDDSISYDDDLIDLVDPDADPGELPGPGDDTGSVLTDHDYDFSEVHEYSDLEYTEIRATLGFRYQLNPTVGLFASASLYDVDDDNPYLQDATGSVELYRAGLSWSF
jgi:hypothetical protein